MKNVGLKLVFWYAVTRSKFCINGPMRGRHKIMKAEFLLVTDYNERETAGLILLVISKHYSYGTVR